MDFHSLSRRDLQFLCKKNRVPANLTNVAMANALHALEIVDGIEEIKEALGFQSPKPITEEDAKIQQQSGSLLRRSRRVTTKTGAIKETPSKDIQNQKFLSFQSPSRTEEVSGNLPKTPAANRAVRGMEPQNSRRRGNKKIEEVGSHVKAMNATSIVTRRSARLSSKKEDEGSKVLKSFPKTRQAALSASTKAEDEEDGKKDFAANAGDLFVDLVDEDEEEQDQKVEVENDKRDLAASDGDPFVDLVEEEKAPDHNVEVDNGRKDFAASTGDSFVVLVEEEVDNGDSKVLSVEKEEVNDEQNDSSAEEIKLSNLDENSIVEVRDETLEYCCDQSIETNDPEKDTREDESAGLSLDNEAADDSSGDQSPKVKELDIHALNSSIEEENEHSIVEEKDETMEHCCEKNNLVKNSREEESGWSGNEAADISSNQSPKDQELEIHVLNFLIKEENLDDVDSIVEEKDETLECCCDLSIIKNDLLKESGSLPLDNETADSSNNQSPRNDSIDNSYCEQLTTGLKQEGILDCSIERDGVPIDYIPAINIVENSSSLPLENEASDKLNTQLSVNNLVNSAAKDMINGELLSPLQPEETVDSLLSNLVSGKSPKNVAAEETALLQYEENMDDCIQESSCEIKKEEEDKLSYLFKQSILNETQENSHFQAEKPAEFLPDSTADSALELSFPNAPQKPNDADASQNASYESHAKLPVMFTSTLKLPSSEEIGNMAEEEGKEIKLHAPEEKENFLKGMNLELMSLTKLRAMYKNLKERKATAKEEDLKGLNCTENDENCNQNLNEDMIVNSEKKRTVLVMQEDLKCLSRSKIDSEDLKCLSRSKIDSSGKIKLERKRTPLKNLN